MKDYSDVLASPVCAVVNTRVIDSLVPRTGKYEDVVPILKISPPMRVDLRPVSLTTVLSTVLECFLCEWVWEKVGPQIQSVWLHSA